MKAVEGEMMIYWDSVAEVLLIVIGLVKVMLSRSEAVFLSSQVAVLR